MRQIYVLLGLFGCWSMELGAQDLFEARPLTEEAGQRGFASWSPDGNYIVYQHAERQDKEGKNGLWRVDADGKHAKHIFMGLAEHPKWSPDGKWIVFDSDTGQHMKLIPAGGGEAREFLPSSIRIERGGLPHWSPDSKRIAFIEGSTGSLYVIQLESGKLTKLYMEEGLLPLPGGWTPDGSHVLVALMDRKTRKSTMWKIAGNGNEKLQITGHHENFYRHLALSPDGVWLVYAAMADGYLGLYIMPAQGGKSLPLAISADAHNEGACWSPDGQRIVFNSTRKQRRDLWVMDLDLDLIQSMIL